MRSVLLCTFAHSNDLSLILDYINKNYVLERNSIYVFENSKNTNDLYCTYNVASAANVAENTIMIHRKKESNTLYTINALNTLILDITGGVLDTSTVINWTDYSNSLLLTVGGELHVIALNLRRVFKT